jgi:hypothetical protein
MSGKLNLKPANVYFLRLVDDIDGRELPFVKVGITDGPVAARIRDLQTGCPFRIVEHWHLDSEAAELVERHLHRTHADRRVLGEWLRCTREELDVLVTNAALYNAVVGNKATQVREYDLAIALDTVLPASPEAHQLRDELEPLLLEHLQVTKHKELAELRLKSMVGTSGGIDGVVRVTVTHPKPGFKSSLFKKQCPELYAQYLRKPGHRCSFSFAGTPTIRAFPELSAELKSAKAAVPKIECQQVQMDQLLDRNDQIAQLHAEFVKLEVQKSTLEGDIQRYELEMRHLCGHHMGIDGICTYKREETFSLDTDALKAEQPDVYNQFIQVGEPSRRVQVLSARSYA